MDLGWVPVKGGDSQLLAIAVEQADGVAHRGSPGFGQRGQDLGVLCRRGGGLKHGPERVMARKRGFHVSGGVGLPLGSGLRQRGGVRLAEGQTPLRISGLTFFRLMP